MLYKLDFQYYMWHWPCIVPYYMDMEHKNVTMAYVDANAFVLTRFNPET